MIRTTQLLLHTTRHLPRDSSAVHVQISLRFWYPLAHRLYQKYSQNLSNHGSANCNLTRTSQLFSKSLQLNQKLVSISQLHTSSQRLNQIPPNPEVENYKTFYRFPHITYARLLSRMKIYQTGFTVIGLPALAIAQSLGYSQGNSLPLATGVTLFAGVMLYVMSHYFRRLIGLMAVNENRDTVKVSHLTFWGKRNDLFVPVKEIVPISDMADKPDDIYVKFCRYGTNEYLYYSLRHGLIMDKEVFQDVLGSLKY